MLRSPCSTDLAKFHLHFLYIYSCSSYYWWCFIFKNPLLLLTLSIRFYVFSLFVPFTALVDSLHLFYFILCSRKKVNINKAVMTYRQEKTRKLGSLDCSTTEHSTLQQDDRTAHTFMDSHNCTAKSEYTNTHSGKSCSLHRKTSDKG